MLSILRSVFGSRNERVLRQLSADLPAINELEPKLRQLGDSELKQYTPQFRQRLDNGEALDSLLPEAFAVVREVSRRTLDMRHFDVQLLGGIVLHQGKIAEMRTGEGKTLVATLAAYLNALPAGGAHVVTVNDYLAKRDAEWMGQIYNFMDMSVGVIVPGLDQATRRQAYQCDISYCTNNELGFDFLRDNMVGRTEDQVQRELRFAIVDEVDSILIDEARTPLIISGPASDDFKLYHVVTEVVSSLKPEHYELDEKHKQAYLTEQGHEQVEQMLVSSGALEESSSLYDPKNLQIMQCVGNCLKARFLFKRDVDYMVTEQKEVLIIDSFTGRAMAGRRWGDGLHQAIEALEKVPVQQENQTLATVTFQNFFKLYNKISGMTGTADTEATEFQQIYGLEVVVVPTHKKMVREDFSDAVFLTISEKYDAIMEDIVDCRDKQQPVLVGTTSIEVSEHISGMLRQKNISHQVLNAKYHEQEAAIIAQAGKPEAVTIATNMAGRGTDIVLGGNQEAKLREISDETQQEQLRQQWQQDYQTVLTAGGLHIIGTERHESRRIDNQLRGRSGRQGDPGSSRFYLSLEDNLMRIFAAERISGIMKKLGMKKGEVIEHPWVNKSIENAQRKVEAHNFDIRKHLLEYDNVANEQRMIIYTQRKEIMAMQDVDDIVEGMCISNLENTCESHVAAESLPESWDLPELQKQLQHQFDLELELQDWLHQNEAADTGAMRQKVVDAFMEQQRQRAAAMPPELMHSIKKHVLLDVLDRHWRDHLQAMDYLRGNINLRAYAHKNPKQEFKREALELFSMMLDKISFDVSSIISHLRVSRDPPEMPSAKTPDFERTRSVHSAGPNLLQPPDDGNIGQQPAVPASGRGNPEQLARAPQIPVERSPYIKPEHKVGRNQPCHCGSGKKYKHCHGRAGA